MMADGTRGRPAVRRSCRSTARRVSATHRRDVPGQARPRAAGGHRRRRRASSTRRWTPRWRPTWSPSPAGHQVVDDGRQHPSSLLRHAPGDQDRRDAADGAGLRLPAAWTCSTRRRDEAVVPTSIPVDPRRCPSRTLVEQAAAMLAAADAADDLHRRRHRLVRGAGRAGARRRAPRRGGLGGRRRRTQHALRPPALPGQTGPHVRRPEPADHCARPTSTSIVGTYMLPEVFPELGDIFAPGAKTIHVDLNAYEIAKNHPVDLGLVAIPS